MSNPLQVGIVGAGLMGRWHAHAAERVDAIVTAVVDPNLDAARALIAQQGLKAARMLANLDALFADRPPDVIHVCTPTASHEALAVAALAHGIPLIVEKPLAATGAATARLLEYAAGSLLCPVHQFLFQDGVLKAQRWLPGLGDLLHVEAVFHSAGGGGGDLDSVIADILPHPLALIDGFLPGRLAAVQWTGQHPRAGELRAHGALDALTIALRLSMNARPTTARFSLFGSRAAVHIDLYHGFAYREVGAVSRSHKIMHPFTTSARSFAAAGVNLIGRAARAESAYPGLRTFIARCYATLREGAPPPIPTASIQATADARDRLCEFLKDDS